MFRLGPKKITDTLSKFLGNTGKARKRKKKKRKDFDFLKSLK